MILERNAVNSIQQVNIDNLFKVFHGLSIDFEAYDSEIQFLTELTKNYKLMLYSIIGMDCNMEYRLGLD